MPDHAHVITPRPSSRPASRRLRTGRHRQELADRAAVPRARRRRSTSAVVTNDIYTDEDARFLRVAGVLDPDRIRAVETGACPHTAIRDDITANLLAVEELEEDFAAARPRPRRVRRRQPHRHLLPRARRRPDLRARRRRRRRRRPQGRPRHRAGRPARRQQDRPRAVRRGRPRPLMVADAASRPRRPAGDRAVAHRPRLGRRSCWPGCSASWLAPRRGAGAERPRPDGATPRRHAPRRTERGQPHAGSGSRPGRGRRPLPGADGDAGSHPTASLVRPMAGPATTPTTARGHPGAGGCAAPRRRRGRDRRRRSAPEPGSTWSSPAAPSPTTCAAAGPAGTSASGSAPARVLTWAGEPFVVAAGADVTARTST